MKQFTVWQLFSVIDGRLATKMEDVYGILDTASGQGLMTHHLPVASDYFKTTRPEWFVKAEKHINAVKIATGSNDFETLRNYFSQAALPLITVEEMPDSEKQEFAQYMVGNSLLLKIGKAS